MRIENKLGLIAAILVAGAAAAQESSGVIGTWRGEHGGKAYLLMSVAAGAPPKIALATSHISIGEDGEISEVDGPVENDETVLEAKLEEGTLRFKTRQEDGSVMEYVLTVTDGGKSALLKIVSAPEFVKPLRLKRA